MAIIDRVKFDGFGGREWLVYKYPEEGLSTATILIVGEGQIAIFVKGGQALDIFSAGSYILSTENIPFINKLINLPFGRKTPFTAEIYYINQTSKLDLFWGTRDPIQVIDPKYNVKLRIRAFGQLGIKVEDYSIFLTELVGTLGPHEVCDFTKVINYFKGLLIMKLKTIIAAEIIKNKISALEITAYLDTLSKDTIEKIQGEFMRFGIKVVNFFIESVNFPDEDFEAINSILKDKATFDIIGDSRYNQKRSFDVYEQAASNQGGVGSTATNIGLGYAIANNIGGSLNNTFANEQSPKNQTNQPNGKLCTCGHENLADAKFCINCGSKITEEKIVCDNCKAENTKNSNYCSSCGSNLGEKTCPDCNTLNPYNAKFCTDCGSNLAR
jgi:membrane protease subunit (stomatin/prohibitin family)